MRESYNGNLQVKNAKENVPSAGQAYILQVHYKHVATSHHLHSFQATLPRVHQV